MTNLREAIKNLHGCDSFWVESVPVTETFEGQVVWKGMVDVFETIQQLPVATFGPMQLKGQRIAALWQCSIKGLLIRQRRR